MASIYGAAAAPAPIVGLPVPSPPPSRLSFLSQICFKRGVVLPLRCSSKPSPQVDSGAPAEKPPIETEDSEKASLLGISTYIWSAGIGTVGFLETGYLTYLKFTNSEAFCPISGGSCSDVLNSDYSFVFGIPLSLIGMVAYGSVALLSLQQIRKDPLSGLSEADVRLLLLGASTSMAAASGYFLYILSTKLAGSSCSYCLVSAILSFALFFISLKDFGWEEIRKLLGLNLAIAGGVIAALSYSYVTVTPQLFGSNMIELEPFETEITSHSTPLAISLAKHLHSIGAKMYGAFWCTHCQEQKQMFGQEAAKILDYVECFPDGVGKGRTMAAECTTAGIEGFPTWIIKGQVLDGEQKLQDLAAVSGFVTVDSQPS